MWQVIHIANSRREAEEIRERLNTQGFLVKIEPISRQGKDGFQILVPEFEAEEVHRFLYEEFSL